MKTLRNLTAVLLSVLVPTQSGIAQQMTQNSEIVIMPDGKTLLQWHAKEGRTYFIQSSDPNDHLGTWIWSSFIDAANDEPISHEVGSTADKAFFRLHYTDTPPPTGVTLEAWDADGDSLSNALELEIQSHPLNSDTNGDGIPDGWAYAHGHLPTANIATGLFNGGPATNLQAYQQGVQANPNATINNRDGDELDNDIDAVPDDIEINWEKTPENRYVWIEQIGDSTGHGDPIAVNKHGQILFNTGKFIANSSGGQIQALWNSTTQAWVPFAPMGTQDVVTLSGGVTETQSLLDGRAENFVDLNDNGTVFGVTTHNEFFQNGSQSSLTTFGMIWKRNGESFVAYHPPKYFLKAIPFDMGSSPTMYPVPTGAIANDGSVNAIFEYGIQSQQATHLHTDWTIHDSASGPMDSTIVKSFPDDYNHSGQKMIHVGAILDKDRALLAEIKGGQCHFWLKEGGVQTDLSFMTPQSFIEAEMSYTTPRTENNPSTRMWITTGNKVYLEKRATGGSGPARWHQPPSMSEGAIRLNERGEAITRGDSSVTPAVEPKLWRNGIYTDLKDVASMPETVTITQAIDLASNGIILVNATESGVVKTGILLPIDFKKIYEEHNPVNFAHDKTPKEDPPPLAKNILYTVIVPQTLDYHLVMEMEIPEPFRTKFMWAIINNQDQTAGEGFFPVAGPADLVFNHNASEWRADYDVFVGCDLDGNSQLDPPERSRVIIPKLKQPLKIHGGNSDAYAESNIAIATGGILGGFVAPLAEALLDIFYFGDSSQIESGWQPTNTSTVSFNCFTSDWSDWLTHNSGADFSTAGDASIKVYTWDSSTQASNKLASAPAITDFLHAMLGLRTPEINSSLTNVPIGTEMSFPSDSGWYDFPINRITFDEEAHLDEYLAVARARISGFKVRFKAKKTSAGVEIIETTTTGVIEDLYDFNYIGGFLSQRGATVQISHGNGSFGSGREAGKIYLNKFEFYKTWNGLP